MTVEKQFYAVRFLVLRQIQTIFRLNFNKISLNTLDLRFAKLTSGHSNLPFT